MARSPYKTIYEVQDVTKYAGDAKKVICRSSWERMLCVILDKNKEVKFWASEEIVIPYVSPLDGLVHRYFVDFAIEFNDGRMIFVEVKPYKETLPPVPPKKRTSKAIARYQKETNTYAVNRAKWKAATEAAKKMGASFTVFTENELRKLGAPL